MSDGKITEQDIQEFASAVRNFVVLFDMYDGLAANTWEFSEDKLSMLKLKYAAVTDELRATKTELSALRGKFEKLLAENRVLDAELSAARSKIAQIRNISCAPNSPYSGG